MSPGFVIMESIEYPVMSGSNTICVATVLLETGMLDAVEPVTNLVLESAAGLIAVECHVRDGKVTSVRFTNQPAFVYELDVAAEQLEAVHPEHPDFPGITNCVITLAPERVDGVLTAKNAVVVSPGRCDR